MVSRADRREDASWRSTCSPPMRLPPTRSKPRRRREPCMKLDGQGLLVLVDPVRTSGAEAAEIGRQARAAGGRGLLIASSFGGAPRTHRVAPRVRTRAPGTQVR